MKFTKPRLNGKKAESQRIVRQAYAILGDHPHFHGRAHEFEIDCRKDVLVVRGAVPTFYLKQLLQSALKDLDGVHRVENQVTVLSVEGDD